MLLAIIAALAPVIAALVAGLALWVNHKAADRDDGREEFDSLVAAYKGLYEAATADIIRLRAQLRELELEIVDLRRQLREKGNE